MALHDVNNSGTSRRTIRFGIMCSGTTFHAWQAACLRKLLTLDHVEPELLIIDAGASGLGGFKANVRKLRRLGNLLWFVYSVAARLVSRATRRVDMAHALAGAAVVRCDVTKRGKYSQYFRRDDVARIRGLDLDFILRFGFNIIRGEILEAARYGVWSFHHDDEERYRGGPPAFWEIYNGDHVVGAILQRLTDRLDSGIVLKKGFFKTVGTSYIRNRDTAFFESAGWPAQVCIDIRNGNADYLGGPPSKTTAPVRRAPSNVQMILFLVKTTRNLFVDAYRRLLLADRWNIGVVEQPITAFLEPGAKPSARWLPAPARNRFSADPFCVRRDSAVHVLFENYNYYTSAGRISSVCLAGGERTVSGVKLDAPFHVSHPYLVEYEGEVYCVPETCGADEVGLHRAIEFPSRWTKVATLIRGFRGVDSTVIQYEGRWWLFATDQNDGPNHKLRIYHAPRLFGPWEPHAWNPAKMDIRSARPAGTPFVKDGTLYRPSQDCSHTYGGRITLNEVKRLTPSVFHEESVGVIEPYENSPYSDGIHTISAASGVTVIDGMRRVFIGRSPSMVVHKVRRILAGP